MIAALMLLQQAVPDVARAASEAVARQECQASEGKDLLVCGRRRRSPHRLPERQHFEPEGDMPSVMRERVAWVEEGDIGPQSCGPVGPGGWTGCMVKAWKRQRDQTQWGKNGPAER